MGLLYLLLIAGLIFIPIIIWNTIFLLYSRYKYANIISCLTAQGYRFNSLHRSKGKGLIYSKSIPKEIMDSILLRYKFSPINIETDYEIKDYVAIIKFPEWEERYPGVICKHGGIRMFHFYRLWIRKEDKIMRRPFNHLDSERCGKLLAPIDMENKKIIQAMLSSGIKDAIMDFHNEELEYWKKEYNS